MDSIGEERDLEAARSLRLIAAGDAARLSARDLSRALEVTAAELSVASWASADESVGHERLLHKLLRSCRIASVTVGRPAGNGDGGVASAAASLEARHGQLVPPMVHITAQVIRPLPPVALED